MAREQSAALALFQAKLQARHGERLTEDDWRALDTARSFDHYLDRARATPLRRFVDRLNASMTSHTIERLLGMAWRDYVAEVASWLEGDWQAAAQWVGYAPDLPTVAAILRDDVAWLKDDARWWGSPRVKRHNGWRIWKNRHLRRSWRRRIAPASSPTGRRIGEFCGRRSAKPTPERTELTRIAAAHLTQLTASQPPDTSAPHRLELAKHLTHLFRRHAASPVAVFSHLALIALDLERLRGGLVRRRLFMPARAQEAA